MFARTVANVCGGSRTVLGGITRATVPASSNNRYVNFLPTKTLPDQKPFSKSFLGDTKSGGKMVRSFREVGPNYDTLSRPTLNLLVPELFFFNFSTPCI